MILVFTLLGRDLAFVMAMIFSGLRVLLWTRRKSAHCGAADGKKPSGIEDGKHHDRVYELLPTSQPRIPLLPMMLWRTQGIQPSTRLNGIPVKVHCALCLKITGIGVVVSLARRGRIEVQSFPRKQESTTQAIGYAPPKDWIPAFAGMTRLLTGFEWDPIPNDTSAQLGQGLQPLASSVTIERNSCAGKWSQ